MSKFRADNNYSQSVGNVKNNTEAYEVSMHDHSYRTVDPINTAGPSSGQQSSNGIPIVIKTEKRSADSGSLLSLQPGSKVFITGNLPFVRSQTSNVARFQVSSTNDTGGASQQVIRSASQPLKRVSVASSSGIVQQIVIPSSTSPVKTIMPHGKLPITQFKSSPTKVTMVQMNPQIRKPGVVSAQKSNLFSQNSVGNVQSEILPSSVGSIIVQNNPSIIVPVNQGNQSLLVHSQLPSQQQQQRITVKTAVSASAAPASWTATTAKPIKPSTQQQAASTKTAQPRLILPAMPAALPGGVMQSGVVFPSGNALPQLPPGTTILSSSQALPGSFQGYALIPAQFVSQLQQQNQHSSQQTTTVKQETSAQSSGHYRNRTISSSGSQVDLGATSSAATLRSRKPCNCTKSQCLKLYCDCFANGEFCSNCNCVSCFNNIEHDEARSRAIKACLDRNPHAFHPKIGKDKTVEGERRHNKGCNCKRSGCLKNYCECYEAKILCSSLCKCVGCRNFEESGEQRTLMHLANAAEVRESQQRAVKSKLSSQMMDVTSKAAPSRFANERLPYTFVTTSIAEATCACLVAQAEDAENKQLSERIEEQLILEEFGRCLLQIIDSANKTRAPSPSPC